jgi:hypothetical protein
VKLLFALALVLLAPAANAHAARPFTIARDGANPGVAVAPDGTAHVVWDHDLSVSRFETHYCRIAPRGRRCAAGSERAFGPFPHLRHQGSQPQVLLGGHGVVVVLASDFDPPRDATYRFTSVDGGRTFGTAAVIGGIVLKDAAFGRGGLVGLVGVTGDAQLTTLAGAAQPIAPLMRTRNAVDQTVAFAGSTPLVAGVAQPENKVLAFRGPAPWRRVPVGAGTDTNLIRSRFGTFLVHGRGLLPYRYVIRRYKPRTGRFGRPRSLRVRGVESDVTVDARGEIVVAVHARRELKVRFTRRHGRRLGALRTVVRRGSSFNKLQVGVGRRGRGLVVWAPGPSGAGVRAAHLR